MMIDDNFGDDADDQHSDDYDDHNDDINFEDDLKNECRSADQDSTLLVLLNPDSLHTRLVQILFKYIFV